MRDLFAGAGYLVRGLVAFAGSPRLWLLGLAPALISVIVLLGLLVAFLSILPTAGDALTPFASGWARDARDALRLAVELVLAGAAVGLALVSYTALTVAIGQPFYEAISRQVERATGDVPAEQGGPWWRAVGRALRDGLVLVVLTAGIGVLLLLSGFLPVVGQTVVPVIGACVTGFFLAVELTSIGLERRGLRLNDRLSLLWRKRLLALGFGVAVFVLFLVPLGAVLGMPGAVAGGTLLARRLAPST